MRIELFGWSTAQQRQSLLEGKIDIAFMLGPFAAPGIATRLLRAEDIVVVMPKGHPLARHKLIEPQQLREQRLIMGSQAWSSIYLRTIFNELIARASQVIAQSPDLLGDLLAGQRRHGDHDLPRGGKPLYRGQLIVRPFRIQHGNVTTICAWTKGSDNAEIEPFLGCVTDPP